ncbi:MAG: hypothetical protein KF780_09420 [Sphingomonas sp.]|nr:hypothetical protein [Sphingomonas sp.]
MSDHEPRLFASDDAIRRLGAAMLACTLPKTEWTHEAHLATCAWLILERPDIVPERDLPHLIRRYNESVGGVNDAAQGYHETITQAFVIAVRTFLARSGESGLAHRVNALLRADEGRRDWPMRFYSRGLLFSTKARLGRVAPDLASLPETVPA